MNIQTLKTLFFIGNSNYQEQDIFLIERKIHNFFFAYVRNQSRPYDMWCTFDHRLHLYLESKSDNIYHLDNTIIKTHDYVNNVRFLSKLLFSKIWELKCDLVFEFDFSSLLNEITKWNSDLNLFSAPQWLSSFTYESYIRGNGHGIVWGSC